MQNDITCASWSRFFPQLPDFTPYPLKPADRSIPNNVIIYRKIYQQLILTINSLWTVQKKPFSVESRLPMSLTIYLVILLLNPYFNTYTILCGWGKPVFSYNYKCLKIGFKKIVMPMSSHVVHIWRSTVSCPHHQRPIGRCWASVCSCPCHRVFRRCRRHSHTRPLCRPCRGQPGLSWPRKGSCPGCSGGRLHRCPGCYRTGLLPGHYLHPSDEDMDVTTG